MKIPRRKLITLLKYSVLGGFIVTVVFVVANFKEKDLNKAAKTTDSEEYSEAEEADKVEAPTSPPTAD